MKRSAIVIGADKDYLLEARLAPLAKAEGLASIDELAATLQRTPVSGLHTKVVEAMTTHETTFFRDLHPFEALKSAILPALRSARAARRTLNVLCAACSSGQEPYSVAMVLREHFPELKDWTVRILATDISHKILERARAGVFAQIDVNRGLPAPMLVKYFDRVESRWEIKPCLKELVEFKHMNLIEPWPALPRFDVVFLRNVLIYFEVATKQRILAQVRRVLAPDGYLFLGGTETTLMVDDTYERTQIGAAVCYRVKA